MEMAIIAFVIIYIVIYRKQNGAGTYKFIINKTSAVYNKYAPYSFTYVRQKIKELGMDYSIKQYTVQAILFSGSAFIISYIYFYNLIVSIVYVVGALMFIPYLSYLRYKRIYSEFIFEQIQVYTTNTIMEFNTTNSFIKAIEGVYESGVLEDPVKSDVKTMIDLAYKNGTIEESLNYMNERYEYHMVKNMHQLFLQITREGAHGAKEALDNMLLDIDMLVEGVYRDRMDRKAFHASFLRYGILLYAMVMLVQWLLGVDTYMKMKDMLIVLVLLHAIILVNSYFLLGGEKYYNENVGVE